MTVLAISSSEIRFMLFLASVLGMIVGYGTGAVVGAWLIGLYSTNLHDRAQEAAMTAAFTTGPLGALIGLGIGLIIGRSIRRRRQT